MQSVFELGLDELDAIVQKLPKTGVIVLRGDLASGKTTLTKAIVASFGIKANVTSPTFSIMQNYENIYHYDIYQNG
ncbi:MAG: tRNA (adenosine(37)-N6)-threonylcarbamoyltransferase complex ATPase subunit type 1 TsaE, partial [Campylobacter hyointestinalis]